MNVYWRVSNQSSATQELVKCSTGWYCKYQLAAGNWGDGIYIIDSANQRKHLVVRTDKKPVVSTSETPLSIEPGSSINLWANSQPLHLMSKSFHLYTRCGSNGRYPYIGVDSEKIFPSAKHYQATTSYSSCFNFMLEC